MHDCVSRPAGHGQDLSIYLTECVLLAAAPGQCWYTTGMAGVAARSLGTPPLLRSDW